METTHPISRLKLPDMDFYIPGYFHNMDLNPYYLYL